MFWIMLFLGVLTSVLIVALTSPFWLIWLAKTDSPSLSKLSPFTPLEDGTGKIIVRNRTFHRLIGRLEGYDIVTPENRSSYPREKLWSAVPRQPHTSETRPFWERWGYYFVGIPVLQEVLTYNFRWRSLEPKKDGSTEYELVLREEEVDTFFLKDKVMPGLITKAETNDKVKVDVIFQVTMRIKNGYQAIFCIHHWNEAVLGLIAQIGRQYIGTKTYDQLIQEEGQGQDHGFSQGIQLLEEEIEEKYGVVLSRADLYSVELTGDGAAEYQQAATAAFTAKAKATAITTVAEAEAKAIRAKGEAETDVLKMQGTARREALTEEMNAGKNENGEGQDKELLDKVLAREAERALSLKAVVGTIGSGIRSALAEKPEGGD